MTKSPVWLCGAVVIAFAPTPSLTKEATPYIYQGKLVTLGDYGAVVGLTYNRERTPRCSGALVAPNLVLSAGHCICEALDAGFYINAAYFGDDPGGVAPGRKGAYFPVKRWWTRYACDEPERRNGADLSILELDRNVIGLAPMRLAPSSVLSKATTGEIVGFGATDVNGSALDYRKRQAEVQIVSRACGLAFEQRKYGCVGEREFVAGKAGSPDTCSGDSGSPLLVTINGDTSTLSGDDLYILGVTSRSVSDAVEVCGAGGVYERIDADALSWIAAIERTVAGPRA